MDRIIDEELARTMVAKLADRHRSQLGEAHFEVEGWREGNRLIVKLVLTTPDKHLYYPMEAGVELETGKEDEIAEALWLAADFLDYYVGEYLGSQREVLLPIDWTETTFGERKLFTRGWERNLALEEAADRWLAEHGGGPSDDDTRH